MNRLTNIRFATYVLLAAAFLWPNPVRHVIPVPLTAPDEVGMLVDASIRKRQEAEDIARMPGFETTRKSGSEVLRLATDRAVKNGTDLAAYQKPDISLLTKNGRNTWLVTWTLKGMPVPGGFFGVLIDDETGAMEGVEGK